MFKDCSLHPTQFIFVPGFIAIACFYIRDGPVDLVGGVQEFVKKNICRARKGHKKICTRNIVKKKFAKQNIKVLALYMFIELKLAKLSVVVKHI